MLAQLAVDIAIELVQAPAQGIEILARIADLNAIGGAVMTADRVACRVDKRAGKVESDLMAAIVAQGGQALDRYPVQAAAVG